MRLTCEIVKHFHLDKDKVAWTRKSKKNNKKIRLKNIRK